MTVRFAALGPPIAPFDVEAYTARRAFALDGSLEPAFVTHDHGAENVARLCSGEALCVTTGQQPGLLTGPLYTLYKALSAIALAQSLEARLDRPVVPVFWVAGDDHDFAEANHIFSVVGGSEIRRTSLRERAEDAPLIPLYREPVGDDIERIVAELTDQTPASEFRPSVFAWLQRHYRPNADLASAFAGAMAELLDRWGLVLFRPTHAAAKRLMAPMLVQALREARALDDALADYVDTLEHRGHSVPVSVGTGATLVFLEAALGRDRLVLDGSGYTARRSGQPYSLDELQTIAEHEPERLSPNVLLRPVIEAAILPTIAYVAGPSEQAYLEACRPIYEALAVPRQAPVPRWSGIAIENHIEKVLVKFGISVEDLQTPEGQLESRLARAELPQRATDAIRALRDTIRAEYDKLADASAEVDPTLRKHVSQAGRGAFREVADIEKRIISHLKKHNDIANQQIAKARAHLFPLGKPQERCLNVVAFLTRYGPSFIEQAAAACAQWSAPLETASSTA